MKKPGIVGSSLMLFAGGASGGALLNSLEPDAHATCACLPAGQHVTIAGAGFVGKIVPEPPLNTNNWTQCSASISTTDVYSLSTNSTVTAYLDFNSTNSYDFNVQGCHEYYGSAQLNCGTVKNTWNPGPYPVAMDIGFSMAGVNSVNNSPWDYYSVVVTGGGLGGFTNLGTPSGGCENIIGAGFYIPVT